MLERLVNFPLFREAVYGPWASDRPDSKYTVNRSFQNVRQHALSAFLTHYPLRVAEFSNHLVRVVLFDVYYVHSSWLPLTCWARGVKFGTSYVELKWLG